MPPSSATGGGLRPGRMHATMDGPFVLFLIGMRFNAPFKPWQWWPVVSSMPRMIRELSMRPELGFISAETWFGRTTLMLQYWRTPEQLLAYASDRGSAHLPAWKQFNQRIARAGDVGIWHETYLVGPGQYENIYTNMPPFGLGRAGTLVPVGAKRETASERLRAQA
jgi:hypothetical protein